MQITENVLQYYEGEISHSVFAIASGFILLVGGFVTIYFFTGSQFLKGLSYVLIGAGIFFMLGGSANILHKNKQRGNISSISEINLDKLRESEVFRMEKVLTSAYVVPIVLFSLSILIGIFIFFFNSNQFLKGIATGLLLAGLFGLLSELSSIKFNRNYYNTIKEYNNLK